MKKTYAACIFVPMFAYGLSCSPSKIEPATAPLPESVADETASYDPEVVPPLITAMPPQPPGPPAQSVQAVPRPTFRLPMGSDDEQFSMADARAISLFYVSDGRSPITNGVFERWEKPGPIHWNGNFTYKNPGDPPDMDIQMMPSDLDGKWALRIMPTGTYIELWQNVKLPELEGGIVLDVTAYVRNPVPKVFAIRITYVAGNEPKVAEVYPAEADEALTRFHARINLPANVGRKSVRMYLTRDARIRGSVIVDGVTVQVVGATGATANQPSSAGRPTGENAKS